MRYVEHAGCRIAYDVGGTGPPVLMIEGVGVAGECWRPQVDELGAPPKLERALAAGIPGARFVEFSEASHGLPIQFPGRANALLLEHFRMASA